MCFNEGKVFNKKTSTSHHLSIVNKVSVNETKHRTVNKNRTFKKNHNNIPSESVSNYFKKFGTIPPLDHLLIQLNVI